MAADEAATGCDRERSIAEEGEVVSRRAVGLERVLRELSEARFQKANSISDVADTAEVGLGFGGLIWRDKSGCAGNNSMKMNP